MKKKRTFYVARVPSGAGCGHQHQKDDAAWHCAQAWAEREDRARRPLPYIEVVKVAGRSETVVGRVGVATPRATWDPARA